MLCVWGVSIDIRGWYSFLFSKETMIVNYLQVPIHLRESRLLKLRRSFSGSHVTKLQSRRVVLSPNTASSWTIASPFILGVHGGLRAAKCWDKNLLKDFETELRDIDILQSTFCSQGFFQDQESKWNLEFLTCKTWIHFKRTSI